MTGMAREEECSLSQDHSLTLNKANFRESPIFDIDWPDDQQQLGKVRPFGGLVDGPALLGHGWVRNRPKG